MTSARLVLLAGLLLAASARGGEPNPARPQPHTTPGQAASVAHLRAVYADYDVPGRTVQGGALEVIQSFSRQVPWRPSHQFVVLLLSPPHTRSHEYHVNGNYRLQVALVREQARRFQFVAKSEPVPLTWARDPNWQQALSRIDFAEYRLSRKERAFGVRVKAEYRSKLQSDKVEKLFLFREDGERLRPILEAGTLACDCSPEAAPTDTFDCFDKPSCPRVRAEAIFQMAPTDSAPLADILETVGKEQVRWRFDGERYQRQGEDPLPL
jgi:hypothetical protein